MGGTRGSGTVGKTVGGDGGLVWRGRGADAGAVGFAVSWVSAWHLAGGQLGPRPFPP
jgi:hypothetical protein